MRMRKFCILFLGFLTLLISCDENGIYDKYNTMPNLGWHTDSIQHFDLQIMDSIAPHNLYINIRNNNSYPFSNLFMIAKLEYPNGKREVDTLEYVMAKSNGEWLGEGGSAIKENKLWFKENFQFSEEGIYKIGVSQVMRSNGSADGITYLKGITDVGLRVETVETP